MKAWTAKALGLTMLAMVLMRVVLGAETQAPTKQVYDEFNAFCLKYYGAEKEPLVYDKFGKDLKVLPDGTWRYVSENSACLAWETNLPATAFVEYGETVQYDKKTPANERPFYLQIHYLKDLDVGKTYHYRLVAVDERGNRIVTPDTTLETRRIADAVRIPGDLKGPPYVIDKKGTCLLTADITSDTGAITIKASGVTLDLNGHTVTYNVKPVQYDDPKNYDEFKKKEFGGIQTPFGKSDLRIFNGTVVQGPGANGAWGSGRGFAPVYLDGGSGEIAGVTCVYAGRQVSGLYLQNTRGYHLHHNVFESWSTDAGNRNLGSSAITSTSGSVHHNLVKRVCHKGITAGTGTEASPVQVYSNEVYVDSWATNAYAIMCYKNCYAVVRDNRIFITGYHSAAIPTIGCSDIEVYGNYIQIEGQKPLDRFKEYGEMSKLHGFRIKYEPKGGTLDFHDNLLVARGRDGACVKCATVKGGKDLKGVIFRNNVFKQTYEGEINPEEKRSSIAAAAQWSGAVAYVGDAAESIAFRDNVIISDYRNISFDDGYYGSGSHAMFVNNRLVRIGNRPDYATISCGWWDKPHTANMLIDTTFEGGAGPDHVKFIGTGKNDFSIAWTLTVKTVPGAKVAVKDVSGKEVFSGVADGKGAASVVVVQYTHAQKIRDLDAVGEKTVFTPHTITVEKDGRTAERKVSVDRKQEIVIRL